MQSWSSAAWGGGCFQGFPLACPSVCQSFCDLSSGDYSLIMAGMACGSLAMRLLLGNLGPPFRLLLWGTAHRPALSLLRARMEVWVHKAVTASPACERHLHRLSRPCWGCLKITARKWLGRAAPSSWLLHAGLGRREHINWVHAEHFPGQHRSTGNQAPLLKIGLTQRLKDNFISLKKERRRERVGKDGSVNSEGKTHA